MAEIPEFSINPIQASPDHDSRRTKETIASKIPQIGVDSKDQNGKAGHEFINSSMKIINMNPPMKGKATDKPPNMGPRAGADLDSVFIINSFF